MGLFDEFNERFSGRFFGKYRGYVTRVDDDPKNMGRIMVKVPVVLGVEDDLGWALPAPPVGGSRNVGFVSLPHKGDFVWVEFEEGDPERPIWSAGPWPLANGESFMPKHAKGAGDNTDYSMREMGNLPPSQFNGSYGKVVTFQGHDGSFLEFDGSDDAHRVQLSHYTGTRIEMTSDGSLQEAIVSAKIQRVAGEYNREVGGAEFTHIYGERRFQVDGEVTESYGANVTQSFEIDDPAGTGLRIGGTFSQNGKTYTGVWSGGYSLDVGGTWRVKTASQASIASGGQLGFMVGQNLQMTVMETAEISVSAATTGQIGVGGATARSILLQGYNGRVNVKAVDVSGTAADASIDLDPTIGNPTATFQAANTAVGVPVGLYGLIHLKGTPAPFHTYLGSSIATEPAVLGNMLVSLLTSLLTELSTHQHPTGVGPSGPPITAAVSTALINQLPTTISTGVVVSST